MFAIRKYVCCAWLCMTATSTTSADVARTEQEIDDECSVYSQAELRICLEKQSRVIFSALERAQDKMRRSLATWDEDDKYIKMAQSRLEAANKAFGQYRETQCAFDAALGGGAVGGTIQSRRLVCEARLNLLQTQHIEKAIANLPRKQ